MRTDQHSWGNHLIIQALADALEVVNIEVRMFNADGSAQTYQNGIHQGRHVTLLFKPTHESVQTTFVIGNINKVHFVTQETQKVLVLRAEIEYGNEFLKYSNMFLAYNEDGPELLNRVIKIALDKEGKETEAARALMQAFDEGGEEALW